MTQETEGLVEAVARALYLVTNEWTQNHDCWSSMPEYGREIFHDRARAILPIVAAHFAEVARQHKADDWQRSPFSGLSQYGHGYEQAAHDITTAIEEVGRHGS